MKRRCLQPLPQMRAIRQSIDKVQLMLQQVKPAAAWAQSNLAVYQHKDAELKGQVGAGWAGGRVVAARVCVWKSRGPAADDSGTRSCTHACLLRHPRKCCRRTP